VTALIALLLPDDYYHLTLRTRKKRRFTKVQAKVRWRFNADAAKW